MDYRRTQSNRPADCEAVRNVQDVSKLITLATLGQEHAAHSDAATDPTVDDKKPPLVQVNKLDGIGMLTRLADLLANIRPTPTTIR